MDFGSNSEDFYALENEDSASKQLSILNKIFDPNKNNNIKLGPDLNYDKPYASFKINSYNMFNFDLNIESKFEIMDPICVNPISPSSFQKSQFDYEKYNNK